MKRWIRIALAAVAVTSIGCDRGDVRQGPNTSNDACYGDLQDPPPSTTVDGVQAFLVRYLRPPVGEDPGSGGACYPLVQIGPTPYVYGGPRHPALTDLLGAPARKTAVSDQLYGVGSKRTREVREVRLLVGVPAEYALAIRVQGNGWTIIGGPPVEGTEMEGQRELAERICSALKDPKKGWSFCRRIAAA